MNPEGAPARDPEWYLSHFDVETGKFAALLDVADLDAVVPTCGDWTVSRLAEHLGQIHRWANFCAGEGRPPSKEEAAALESYDPDRAADWYREGASTLADTLASLDPDAPTWHPFPVEQVNRFWPRRQAHEVVMHRWDLEHALGAVTPIDAELASDGIDEYFGVVIPRIVERRGLVVPIGSFHVHCTDVEGEWLVWEENDEYQMKRAHEKGDAALRGPAAEILLRLWGRTTGMPGDLDPIGDVSVLDGWLSISGM